MKTLCHLSPTKVEGPEARERSEPSGTTTQRHCASVEVGNQVGFYIDRYYWDTSPEGRLARLFDVLRVTTVNALEARDNLEIDKPHEHVDVLRKAGHNIQASFLWVVYPDGVRRYATRYELKPGPYQPWCAVVGERL